MKTIQTKAEQEFYQEVIQLVASDAPDGWIIAVMKFELSQHGCEMMLDRIDSTGHVIWFDTGAELHEKLCRSCRKFQLASGQGSTVHWKRGSLTLSSSGVIAADFWHR